MKNAIFAKTPALSLSPSSGTICTPLKITASDFDLTFSNSIKVGGTTAIVLSDKATITSGNLTSSAQFTVKAPGATGTAVQGQVSLTAKGTTGIISARIDGAVWIFVP